MVKLRNQLMMATAAAALGTLTWASAASAESYIVGASVTCGASLTCNGATAGEIYMLTTSELQGKTASVNWTASEGASFGGFDLYGNGAGADPAAVHDIYPPFVANSASIEGEESSGALANETLTLYMTITGLTQPADNQPYTWTTGYENESGSDFTVTESVEIDDTDAGLYNNGTTAATCGSGGSSPLEYVCGGGVGVGTGATGLASGYGSLGTETLTPGESSSPIVTSGVTENTPYSVTMIYTITLGSSLSTGAELLANESLTAAVPEPASLSLMGGALLAFGAWRRRRNKAA